MSLWRDLVLLQIWGDAGIEIIKPVPQNIQLSKELSQQIPWSTECSLHPELPQGMLKVNSYSSVGFHLCKGRWQTPLLSVIGNALGKCQIVFDISNPTCPNWASLSPQICSTPVSSSYFIRTLSIFHWVKGRNSESSSVLLSLSCCCCLGAQLCLTLQPHGL